MNYKQPILAHIFVHFFKIGGGEGYLSNFNKYNLLHNDNNNDHNDNSHFKEVLLINKNYTCETLFHFNMDIIFYSSYEELNQYLLDYNFDIILDHQLYWYSEINIEKIAYANIFPHRIIRVIHGVPIHFKNIEDENYYYSIELYKEEGSHKSWNNHIKYYNNLGVYIDSNIDNICDSNKVFNKDKINVAIVGRIYEDKISFDFIKLLVRFANAYKSFYFNFYGVIGDHYIKIFMHEIKKSNNIIYKGIVDPIEKSNIYLENDILLHPSKMEAGATVILEAMSYGLPVIGRKCNGVMHAVGEENHHLLGKTDMEILELLLNFKKNVYDYGVISRQNIMKVRCHNDEKVLFNRVIKDLQNIYKTNICMENGNSIPNIIHYIFGLEKQTHEFPFVYYLSIYSNYVINKPYIIYFHYQYMPYGMWWDKAKDLVKLNYVNMNNVLWGNKKIVKYAHKADKLRLELLYKYGGIYMDIDTITYRSYHHLLNYDFVIGKQEENYGINNITLYCNAIMLSKAGNKFIKYWLDLYEMHFETHGWCEASVHLPHKIFELIKSEHGNSSICNIKIMDKESFYYPSYNQVNKIFEDSCDDESMYLDKLITLHYWNSYSNKYYNNICDFDYCVNNNTLYAKIMKKLLE